MGKRLTLWVPLNAAAPCWLCGRLGHVKVDEESDGRFHGFCQTQIRKQPSHSPHACQACRRHSVVCIPALKGVRPSWSHASPPIRRPLWRWHCCSLLRCRLVPQRSSTTHEMGFHDTKSGELRYYEATVRGSTVLPTGKCMTDLAWTDPSWDEDKRWQGKLFDLASQYTPWRASANQVISVTARMPVMR